MHKATVELSSSQSRSAKVRLRRKHIQRRSVGVAMVAGSLVSTIAVPDLLYQGQLITADTYRPLETYTIVALVYFVLLFPATVFAQWYERRVVKG